MKQFIAIIATIASLSSFAAEPAKAVAPAPAPAPAAATPAPAAAPAKKEVAKQADTKSTAPAATAKTEAPKK